MPAALLAIGLAAVSPRAAFAQSSTSPSPSAAPDDVLALRDGTMVRGHVVAARTGQFVNIRVATGETQTIAWEDIGSATGPGFPNGFAPVAPPLAAAPAPVANAPAGDAQYRTPGVGRVRLVVESTGDPLDVSLWVGTDGDGDMVTRQLCTTPCTLYVPPGDFPIVASNSNTGQRLTHLAVPDTGVRVRMYAGRPLPAWQWGLLPVIGILFWGGIGIVSDAEHIDPRQPGEWYGIGAACAGLGLALAAVELVTTLALEGPTGVQSSQPLGGQARRSAPHWAFGVAPVSSGASVLAGVRF